ncbi:MAG: biotin/lipoyl-binding protein, partial [Burkholderiales bacterium]|nr:biotin/lipoyl-binding protein [Burkholderiales bacterium]
MSTESPRFAGRAIALILVLAVLGTGLYIVHYLDKSPRTDDAYAYADTVLVTPEVSGRIVEMDVRDNEAVKRGDVLFQIDPRPFQQTLAKAQATLASLDNEIVLTQRSVNAQKLGAAAATASVERARATA